MTICAETINPAQEDLDQDGVETSVIIVLSQRIQIKMIQTQIALATPVIIVLVIPILVKLTMMEMNWR